MNAENSINESYAVYALDLNANFEMQYSKNFDEKGHLYVRICYKCGGERIYDNQEQAENDSTICPDCGHLSERYFCIIKIPHYRYVVHVNSVSEMYTKCYYSEEIFSDPKSAINSFSTKMFADANSMVSIDTIGGCVMVRKTDIVCVESCDWKDVE